jgi:hypothetical protein
MSSIFYYGFLSSLLLIFSVGFLFFKRKVIYLEEKIVDYRDGMQKQAKLNNLYAEEINNLGKHLSKLEGFASSCDDKIHKMNVRQPDLDNYQQATMIFQKGGTLEEVLRSCSISVAEAKFVQSLVQKEFQV